MWAATAWDDSDWDGNRARGWTVMGRIRERQERHRAEASASLPRIVEGIVSLASTRKDYEDSIKASWNGGPLLLAFLFAQPDCDAIRTLDTRGAYFDQRTGNTWDLFFPGYYKSTSGERFECEAGSRSVGRDFADDWYFSARDFDTLRDHVERSSGRRWEYSGDTDLVLIGGWMPQHGELMIDWSSTISGVITDRPAGATSLTLGGVIERISRDLETAAEDGSYGVGEVTDGPPASHRPHAMTREFIVNALGGIAAALGARVVLGG